MLSWPLFHMCCTVVTNIQFIWSMIAFFSQIIMLLLLHSNSCQLSALWDLKSFGMQRLNKDMLTERTVITFWSFKTTEVLMLWHWLNTSSDHLPHSTWFHVYTSYLLIQLLNNRFHTFWSEMDVARDGFMVYVE